MKTTRRLIIAGKLSSKKKVRIKRRERAIKIENHLAAGSTLSGKEIPEWKI